MSGQFTPQSIPTITVEELASRLAEGRANIQLVDVREAQEFELASIEGFELFPLSEFEQWSVHINDRQMPVEKLWSCAITECDRPKCANG